MLDVTGPVQGDDELLWEPMRVVPPDPWTGHIPFAFWLIRKMRPATFVELGTHSGNSYFAFCQAMAATAPTGRAFAVDTWVGDEHAGHYGEDIFAEVTRFNLEHFRQFSTLLRTTFDDARGYFPDGSVDLLHIDGMHSYDAVRGDLETWRSALSPSAVVLFHDINVRERDFGVWKLWHELSTQYPAFTFDHSNGLGVLGIGPEQGAAMQSLFALSGDATAAGAFRRRVAARGEAFQWQARAQALEALLQTAQAQVAQSQAAQVQAAQVRALTQADTPAADAQHQGPEGHLQSSAAASDPRALEAAWFEAVIAAKREVIAAKDAQIAALGNIAAARLTSLEVRDDLIRSRDSLAASLLHDLNHQRFMVSEERRVRFEMQEAYEKEITRISLEREAIRQSAARDLQAARHHTANAVSAAYVRSTSWRLTRPLRVATRLLKGGGATPPQFVPPPLPPSMFAPPALEHEGSAKAADDAKLLDAADDVTAETPVKRAMRTAFAARLDAFLSGQASLVLPHAEAPEVSIILVLYNQAELTFACLSSIVETLGDAPFGVEVVIVDNGSTDQTVALLGRLEGARLLKNGANLHFLRAVNLAAGAVRGRTILLLNNDAQLLPGSVAAALNTLDSDDDIGAVGGRIILPDGTLQEAGSIIWQDGTCSGYARGEAPSSSDVMFQRDVDYCSGAFLLTPTKLFRKMGGFDERFAPAYYEETDYCVRLWEGGHRVVYDPDAVILHYEFGSSKPGGEAIRLQAANQAIFVAQHKDWLSTQYPVSPLNVLVARRGRSKAPRILMLEDRVPKPELGSGYPRANRLAHELLEAGADVTFYPMSHFKEDWHGVRRALDKRIEVQILAEASRLELYLRARTGEFDAVLVCRPHNMESLLTVIGPQRNLLGDVTVLYDAEALFVTRTLQKKEEAGEPASPDERRRLIAEEVSLTRLAKTVISVAAAEQATFEDFGVRQVNLIGHALEDEPIATGFDERDQMVFLGAMREDHAPNSDSVRWFAAEVLPLIRQALKKPELRLTVIGDATAKTIKALDGKDVDLVGRADDLGEALSRARLMVVPTRFAAGIPHKVHHSAMLGIPMVATGLIAGQVGWEDGRELLVADDAASFASACARLYGDRDLWESIRASALAHARIDCSPELFTKRVRELVSGIPIVHRVPEGAPRPLPIAPPFLEPQEPHTSRPAEVDWSVAVPFGFPPLGTAPGRIAVICHLFHIEVAQEVLFYLRNLPAADVFISTNDEAKRETLQRVFAEWDRGTVEVRVTPNRGRDIAPKLIGFAEEHGRYDMVLHLHSKMSTHVPFLTPWRSYLFETLLGSPEIVRSILDAFARLPDLGMVAPQHYEAIRPWLGWNGNFREASALAARMGITLSPRAALDFPSGSMFWARPAALKPLLDLGLQFEDFPDEGAQVDHTPAHAIERLYFYACERSGHSWLKVTQPALVFDTTAAADLASPAALSQFVADHGVMLSGTATLPVRQGPARMMTRVAPGLTSRLATRAI